jgi:hypothetical protein
MKSLGRGLFVLGFFFILSSAAILLFPAFHRQPFALVWWITTSFLLGFALVLLGAHLWSKNGARGA